MTLADTLLVIDMQNGVLSEKGQEIYGRERLLKLVNHRISDYRSAAKPVVFIQHHESGLEKNSAAWRLADKLDFRKNDNFVDKTHADSFYQTDLSNLLKNLSVKSIELCGAQTEYCVDSTIKAAFDRAYALQMLPDASSTYDNEYMSAEQTVKFYENIWKDRFLRFVEFSQ